MVSTAPQVVEIDSDDAESWSDEIRLEILARLIMKAEQGGITNGKSEEKGRVLEPNV